MNVTESRFKNRQLHMEDYLQMVSAEQKEYAEVFDYSKITEKSGIITDYWTNNLLDLILRKDNLNKAYKQVESNKGAGGIDGMQVDEILPYLRERRRIRAVYWKQWKKIKTKYRMLKALGCEHWRAKELACRRKGYWRVAQVLNQIFLNKIIAKLEYTSMLGYYSIVYEN